MVDMDTERKKLVKAGPMARRIGVTVRWLKSEADAGRIPCLKAENIYLFNSDVVLEILAQRAEVRDDGQ